MSQNKSQVLGIIMTENELIEREAFYYGSRNSDKR